MQPCLRNLGLQRREDIWNGCKPGTTRFHPALWARAPPSVHIRQTATMQVILLRTVGSVKYEAA